MNQPPHNFNTGNSQHQAKNDPLSEKPSPLIYGNTAQFPGKEGGAKQPSGMMYAGIYKELFDIVRFSLSSSIDKSKIENAIVKIVEAFGQKPANELLLYSYSISKDNYIIGHIANNVVLAVGFAVNLGLPKNDIMDVGLCAFGHDFGMAEYTHLFQQGHQLSEDENKMLHQHPLKSVELFKPYFSDKVIAGIMDIHEQVNGQGYPHKKTSLEISFMAKLVAICDMFIALTHPRNFRKQFNPYEAMKMIIKGKDTLFDSLIVKRFLEFMSIYPIGCLVSLNTGETAMVISSNRGFPTRSIVQVLLTAKREVDRNQRIVDLLEDNMIYINGVVTAREEMEIMHVLKPRGDFDF